MSLVVVCRTAREPLSHNQMTLGYNCVLCNEPLQVSPTGLRALKAGGRPFCNPCGLKFLRDIDPDELAGIMATPQAYEQLNRAIERAKNAEKN